MSDELVDVIDENLDDSSINILNCKRIDYETGAEYPASFEHRYDPQTRTLTVYIDNSGEVQSGNGGKVEFSIKVKPDVQPGTVITDYATVYFPSVPEETKTNAIISVVPVQTKVEYSGDLVVQYSDTLKLVASLKTLEGSPLPDKPITFFINSSSYTETTDYAGEVLVYTDINKIPGEYTIITDFAGDNFYNFPSQESKSFVIMDVQSPSSKSTSV